MVYDRSDDLMDGYARKQVAGLSRVRAEDAQKAAKFDELKIHQFSMPAYVGLFLNLKSPLLNNIHLRKALSLATDRTAIIESGLNNEATPAYFPVIPTNSHENLKNFKLDFDLTKAQSELKQVANLSQSKPIRLVTIDTVEMTQVAEMVKQQWSKLGVSSEIIKARDTTDLQQRFIRARDYDVLLYGQNIGVDADIYSFWHSSQINDPGLNLSNYKNAEADKLLESGRLAKDAKYRSDKYVRFNQIWSTDAPAILLYSPYYLYGQNRVVRGVTAKKIVQPSDRFWDIQNWYMKSKEVPSGHIN